ncbi:hypothetical protein [Lederbergia ruris]
MKEKVSFEKQPKWAPVIQKFSRDELEKAWPRVLTVESALYASGRHKTVC